MSLFVYCPLVWMIHSRALNYLINGLHKRALSLVHRDFLSSFLELLENDKSVTIHDRNLRKLVYKIFKVRNSIVPEIFRNCSHKESNFNLRNSTVLQVTSII